MSTSIPPGASDFFSTMRERHAIYLRRKAGLPAPWTTDPVMQTYSITNPYRENDRTTRWLKDNVRERIRGRPDVLLAIVLFRWFNRIETGQAIFQQTAMFGQDGSPVDLATAWDCRGGKARDWVDVLRASIVAYCGKGPYVTGSYIIQGWRGYNKLDGVLECVRNFVDSRYSFDGSATPECQFDWYDAGSWLLQFPEHQNLESTWNWLRQFPYLGDFMAHEIVQDLRYTDLLCHADDINTWSNPGPGAERGLARVYGRDITGNIVKKTPKAQLILEMRELLELSRSPEYWPIRVEKTPGFPHMWKYDFETPDMCHACLLDEDAWPALELHQIEMWLCEFQKIMKARTGEGRPRGKFHGRAGRA